MSPKTASHQTYHFTRSENDFYFIPTVQGSHTNNP
ncbi:BnaC04g24210D [Brassica napus]|uniref:BnaC04g24210D protein n=2 Tax=Brassica TaxID=3705 RepID=A0A078H2B8_BRANA|nr:BnaC04g24210D [Brassica napus]VDD09604.1 unnamed protein product [Brassica oleracea]